MNIIYQNNAEEKLQNIKALIWDLDNTLYRVDEALIEAFNIGVARAVRAAGLDLSMEKAVAMARQSFLDHGYSGHVFVHDYGIDRALLHYEFHGYVDEKMIEVSREAQEILSRLSMTHALITHGSKEWAQRVLAHLDILEHFPEDRIIALETNNFVHKYEGAIAFEQALQLLGQPADQTALIEDTMQNLPIPFDMKITTILIHHGQKPNPLPAFVDIACNSTLDILEKFDDIK